MTYSKGFFVIYSVIALCLVSFLIIMTISHQAHITEAFQEAILMQKSLAVALNTIEELRGTHNQDQLNIPPLEIKKSKDCILRTHTFCVQKIVVTVYLRDRILVSLTSGVLCEQ